MHHSKKDTHDTTPDDWYETLLNAHTGLSEAQSGRLHAALILLLANEIDDLAVLRGFLQAARAAVLTPEAE